MPAPSKEVLVQAHNVKAEFVKPGDLVLRLFDGAVTQATAVRSITRGDESRIIYKTAATQRCPNDTIFTVLRPI